MRSKIIRVSSEHAKELEEFARKNNMKIVEASKEFAKVFRQNKGRKLTSDREIKF